MENGQNVSFWTIRWNKIRAALLVAAPIAVLAGVAIGMLTTSATGCVEFLPGWFLCRLPKIY